MPEIKATPLFSKRISTPLVKEYRLCRLYVDIADVILLAIGREQNVKFINRRGCEILGKRRKEVIGKNWFDTFFPQDQRESARLCFQGLMGGGKKLPRYGESYIYIRNGQERLMAWRNSLWRDEGGRIAGVVSSLTDITDRRIIEKRLQRSENLYRTLFENTGTAMLVVDFEMNILMINKEFERISGYSKREVEGRMKWDSFIWPQDLKSMRLVNEQLKKNPETARRNYEFRSLDRKNRLRYNQLTYDIIPGTKTIIASIRDISDLKLSLNKFQFLLGEVNNLSRSSQRHSSEMDAIFHSIAEPLCIFDDKGMMIRSNASVESFVGFNPQGLSIKDFFSRIRLRSLEGEPAGAKEGFSYRLLFEGEVLRKQKCLFTMADGSSRILLVSGTPVLSKNKVCAVVIVLHDITDEEKATKSLQESHDWLEKEVADRTKDLRMTNQELRRQINIRWEAQKALHETNELLERMFNNTHVQFAYMDPRFNFIRVNKAYAEIDGKTPDYFIGKNHFELYPDPVNREIFRHVVRTGREYRAYGRPFIPRKDPEGGVTYWDWSLAPVKNGGGRVEGVVLCLLNVSERKYAQEKLMATQRKLFESRKLADIGALAATVAHELRNPLGTIQSAAYNIRWKFKVPAIEPHLRSIEKKIQESDDIIKELLFYSRLREPQKKKCFPVRILKECLKNAGERFKDPRVKVTAIFEAGKDLELDIDSLQISEVFNNIINNAYDALLSKRGKKELVVRTDISSGNEFCVTFKDSGIGIEKQDLQKIFEPFFTNKVRGTGLGLSICQKVVSLHDGRIEVESEPGKGSVFKIFLPVEAARQKRLEDMAESW
ncbi:MAG: PAS domain S-box protein [Candidatus Omnitrophota bacterium]